MLLGLMPMLLHVHCSNHYALMMDTARLSEMSALHTPKCNHVCRNNWSYLYTELLSDLVASRELLVIII